MISFENTAISFKGKSTKDLRRAYWLFKIIGNNAVVKIGKWVTNTALMLNLPINGIIKKTIFKQFCGGETIKECDRTINQLAEYGIGTILDYSVEGKTSQKDIDSTVKEIIATIEHAKGNASIPFAVFKITGIARYEILVLSNEGLGKLNNAELQEYEGMKNRVDQICKAAFEADVPVFIDAEETWIQDSIDHIVTEMMEKYNKEKAIIFNSIQMYRVGRLTFLKNRIQIAKSSNYFLGTKLIRGAYMEKERRRAEEFGYPSPIQPTKGDTDRDFNTALELIIDNIEHMSLCAGTHNEYSSTYLTELMAKKGLEKDDKRVYFGQLLGMSDHISYNLAFNHYKVAKYVPYGPVKEVLPYLLRRADENTSARGQSSRELSLITKERNRRRNKK
jgi:proline dehydrogenase